MVAPYARTCVPAEPRPAILIPVTNPLKPLNGEMKRRTEVVDIFPNETAITRLVAALLFEQNHEWAVQRPRYVGLGSISPIGADPLISLPTVAA
jgi:putative transposase